MKGYALEGCREEKMLSRAKVNVWIDHVNMWFDHVRKDVTSEQGLTLFDG